MLKMLNNLELCLLTIKNIEVSNSIQRTLFNGGNEPWRKKEVSVYLIYVNLRFSKKSNINQKGLHFFACYIFILFYFLRLNISFHEYTRIGD